MNVLHARLEPLLWESHFFGLNSAIICQDLSAPPLSVAVLNGWPRVQAKIAATDSAALDSLQQLGFRLVEGEIDCLLPVSHSAVHQAQIAQLADIPSLRAMAAQCFSHSRFRSPWYVPEASSRFYAQWVENAVLGTFDHQCLLLRGDDAVIRGFVSLRQLNEQEARIGLLAGRGCGAELIQVAINWAHQRQLTRLRVATQAGNLPALKRYLASGASVESLCWWLYR